MTRPVKYPSLAKKRTVKSEVGIEIGEYERSVTELVDAAKRFPKLDSWQKQLPAAISHWLLSGTETTRILGAEFHSIWNEFTKSHGIHGYSSVLSDGKQMALPLGITLDGIPFPPPTKQNFTFIDLFAGIGGFRIHHAIGPCGRSTGGCSAFGNAG